MSYTTTEEAEIETLRTVRAAARFAFERRGYDPAAPVETSVPEDYELVSCVVCGGTDGHVPFASPLDDGRLPRATCPVDEFLAQINWDGSSYRGNLPVRQQGLQTAHAGLPILPAEALAGPEGGQERIGALDRLAGLHARNPI
jgi:hypothetical protein